MAIKAPMGRLAAGLGWRRHTPAGEIIALIETVLAGAGAQPEALGALLVLARKADDPVLETLARHFGVPIHLVPEADLPPARDASEGAAARWLGLSGVSQVLAALAGPLVADKQKSARATCALSELSPAFEAGAYCTYASRSARTASTLAASGAGR